MGKKNKRKQVKNVSRYFLDDYSHRRSRNLKNKRKKLPSYYVSSSVNTEQIQAIAEQIFGSPYGIMAKSND